MDDEEIIRQVVEKVMANNQDLAASDVEDIVREEFALLANRPVRDYLSILTERSARRRFMKLTKTVAT